MRITITDDFGEVYAHLTDVSTGPRAGEVFATDDDGERTTLVDIIRDAETWERTKS